MTRTPKAASAARTGPTTTASDAATAEAAPQAGENVEVTVTTAELPQTTIRPPPPRSPPPRPPSPTEDDYASSSDGEIPLCDAPVVKKRRVETVATSRVLLTDSERYKREDAGCAARLKKQEPELLPCRDPDEGEDDQGVGDRFQGYDGFTIGGPPVFR